MGKFLEKRSKELIIAIILLGIILRFVFIQTNNVYDFQYDVGLHEINNKNLYEYIFSRDERVMLEYRHLDYIMIIFLTNALPIVNDVQLYHPPLHHIISAGFLKVIDNFDITAFAKIESLQILTLIYSIVSLIIVYKILKEFNLKEKYMLLALVIMAVHPLNIYFSGLINNDSLLTMFSLFSVLYTIKWYKNNNYKNAILLAISIGLGMLTKTSMMISIGIAGLAFLMKLFEELLKDDKKDLKNIIIQGIIFFIIVIPMSICFPIRNYNLFGQSPFGIIEANENFQIDETEFNKRWGLLNKDLLNNDLNFKDANIPSYVIKSSTIFAVERNLTNELIPTINKIANIIIIFISLVSCVSVLLNKKIENKKLTYILMISTILWILSFIMFNLTYPASCTMHARYIITALITNIIIISVDFNYRNYNKIYKSIVYVTIAVFACTSIFLPWL